MTAAGQVAATRDEEAEGYLDHLLARPVARLPWLAGRFAVSAAVLAVDGLVGLGASRWLLDTSVLHHITRAPVNWDSLVILAAIGIAAAIAGTVAFTRRDLAGA